MTRLALSTRTEAEFWADRPVAAYGHSIDNAFVIETGDGTQYIYRDLPPLLKELVMREGWFQRACKMIRENFTPIHVRKGNADGCDWQRDGVSFLPDIQARAAE